MNISEYQHLCAERAELFKLLAQIPEKDIIVRICLLARKETIESILANKMPLMLHLV